MDEYLDQLHEKMYYCPYCGDDMGEVTKIEKEKIDVKLKKYVKEWGVCPHWNDLDVLDDF